MKFKLKEEDKSRVLLIVIGLLLYAWLTNFVAVNSWIRKLFSPITPIFAGVAIAYLLSPVCRRIENFLGKKFLRFSELSLKERRTISLIITYYLTLMVIAAFAVLVLPQVIASITQMFEQIKLYVTSAENIANNILAKIPEDLIPDDVANEIRQKVGNMMSELITVLSTSVPAVFNYIVSFGTSLVNIVVAFFVSIYVLASKETFLGHGRKLFYAIFGKEKAEKMFEVVDTADDMFGGFISGKLIDSLIIGIICYIGVLILKIPFPVLIAFIVGVTNVVPFFGPLVGEVIGFFLVVIIDPLKGVITLAFLLVLQQLDGNVIGPKILSSSTGLSAFWVMTSILFFGGCFGVVGMVIGVPLFGVIYWEVKRIVNNLLEKKGLSTDSEDYMKGIKKTEYIDE